MAKRKGQRKATNQRRKVKPRVLTDAEVLKINQQRGKVGVIELSEFPYIKNQIDSYLERTKTVNEIFEKSRNFKAKSVAILEQIGKFRYGLSQKLNRLGFKNSTQKAIETATEYKDKSKELRKAAEKLELQNAAAVNACIRVLLEIEGVSDKGFSLQEGKVLVNLI